MKTFLKSVGQALAPYRKAILSGLLAAIPVGYKALADGHLSHAELGLIVGAFVAGAGIVYRVPNAPELTAKHKAE